MSMIVKGSDYEKPREGEHNAICINVVDVGEQERVYNGRKSSAHKCAILFEVEECCKKGERAGKPMMISKEFTFSLSEKANLRAFIEWWFQKKFTSKEVSFDLETLIGKCAKLVIVHSNGFANIATCEPPVKKLTSENIGYVTKYIQNRIDKRLDQPGETIPDEYFDDPNKAFDEAAVHDGVDTTPLTDDDMPFKNTGDEIPY